MATRENIGRRVRQAREERGLSQTELGRSLSRPRTHVAISDLELGKVKLDAEELGEIASILKKDISFFYFPGAQPSFRAPSGQIVYRRGDRGMSDDERQQTDRAVEAFKSFARKKLKQAGPDIG